MEAPHKQDQSRETAREVNRIAYSWPRYENGNGNGEGNGNGKGNGNSNGNGNGNELESKLKSIADLSTAELERLNKGILPVYPVSFLIAKDISIKISTTKNESNFAKTLVEKATNSAGGVLIFSYSESSQNDTFSTSHSIKTEGNSVIITIPGPQIIGYSMEVTPEDNALDNSNKAAQWNEDFLPKSTKGMKYYNSVKTINKLNQSIINKPTKGLCFNNNLNNNNNDEDEIIIENINKKKKNNKSSLDPSPYLASIRPISNRNGGKGYIIE